MVTRVGPLELVIIGLEKASLVTHNGSFPPILVFVQSFSSLLCIIFSPHLNDTKRSKRLIQNSVFSLQIQIFPIFQAISSRGKYIRPFFLFLVQCSGLCNIHNPDKSLFVDPSQNKNIATVQLYEMACFIEFWFY